MQLFDFPYIWKKNYEVLLKKKYFFDHLMKIFKMEMMHALKWHNSFCKRLVTSLRLFWYKFYHISMTYQAIRKILEKFDFSLGPTKVREGGRGYHFFWWIQVQHIKLHLKWCEIISIVREGRGSVAVHTVLYGRPLKLPVFDQKYTV